MNAIPSAHLIPRYPPHVHTGTWGTLETFTPAVRANKVCTARRAKRNNTALMAPKKPSSTQNTTLQTMGMDVIKQYPGPLTVSRAVKVDVPGKHFPQPAADRQGAQQLGVPVVAAHRGGDHRALHAEARQRLHPLGCTVLHLAGPIELRRCRFGCAILGLGPSAGPSTSGHAADPPSADTLGGADMSLLQRAGVLQNTPYDA